jgi:hypothetical protein
MNHTDSGLSAGLFLWQLFLLGVLGLVVYFVVKLIRNFKK